MNVESELALALARIRDLESELAAAREELLADAVILQNLAEGVNVSDEHGIIVFTNPSFERMFGYEPDELLGKHLSLLNAGTAEESARLVDAIIRSVRERGVWQGEFANKKKDGTRFATRAYITSAQIAGAVHWISVQDDVTLRKRAEEALQASELRYRSIVEMSSDWIWEVNLDGKHTYCNSAGGRVLGYPLDEFMTMSAFDLIHDDDRQQALELMQRAVDQSSGWREVRLRWRHSDGTYRTLESRADPILDESGNVVGFRGVDRDVTERLKAEERLAQAEKLQAIGQLAGGVAHDFNNMLAAIMGNAEVLLRHLDDGAKTKAFAREILLASERAASLVKQLLLFARKGAIQRVEVDVHALIDEVLQLLSRSFDPRIELTKRLCATQSFVLADPSQLHSALLNLALNARDSMPDGGTLEFATAVVHSSVSPTPSELLPGPHLAITVSDTGVGMTDEVRRQIFEPFFTTKTGRGTGLGLAGVYGAMLAQNGRVRVTSEVGRGTSFELLLPLCAPSRKGSDPRRPALACGSGTVLVLDDEELVREFLRTALTELGYEVLACADGEEALERFERSSATIGLCVIDLMMPKLGGEQVFAAMKRIDPEVRVVVCSGFGSSESIARMHELGVCAILEKPVRLDALADTVAAHIRS